MRYSLMHKNIVVADIEIDEVIGGITNIYDVFAPNHLPIGVYSKQNGKDVVDRYALNQWFADRCIPKHRMSIQKLYEQLQTTKGKKVYGYLPNDVKETVDEVFSLLAQDTKIQELYGKWCDFEKAKYRMYTQKDKDFPALIDNKEFRSVRNMIIRTIMKMDSSQAVSAAPEFIDIKDDIEVQAEETIPQLVNNNTSDTVSRERALKRIQARKYIVSSDEKQDISKGIKILTELADNGDDMSAYKLGQIYLKGDIVYRDFNKAEKYLRQASADNEYAMYTLAKLCLTEEKKNLSAAVKLLEKACRNCDIAPYAAYAYAKILLDNNQMHDNEKAIQLLKDSSTSNSWCSYMLGKLYLFGNDEIEINKAEAERWLKLSAEAGNEHAQRLLDYSDNYRSAMFISTVSSLIVNLGRIIEEDNRRSRKNMPRSDRKLMQVIQRKKRELGIKSDEVIEQSY